MKTLNACGAGLSGKEQRRSRSGILSKANQVKA